MLYVSANDIAESLSHRLDVYRKFMLVGGKPTAIEARIPSRRSNWQELGFELESTILWLMEKVPTFRAENEKKLRAYARHAVR